MNLLALSTGMIIDIVAAALILIITIASIIRGFAKTFISTFGSLLSLLIAVLLASLVTTFLEKQFGMVTAISNGLSGVLTNIFGDIMNTTIGSATEGSLVSAGISGWLIQIIMSVKGGDVPNDVSLSQVICPVFGYYVSLLISVIILFIIFKIIFFLIGEIIKKCTTIKIVKWLDKLLGFLLGIIKGIVTVEIIILILQAIPLGFCQSILSELPNAPFTLFINNINLYGIILTNFSFADVTSFIKGMLAV